MSKPIQPSAPEPPAHQNTDHVTWVPSGDGATPRSADSVPTLAPPPLGFFGEYRLLEVLGQGGMGIVYRTQDPHLRRDVAIKLLNDHSPRARQRFLQEARAQAAIEHDHVLAIHAVGEIDGTPYLVMPLLRGRTLASFLLKTKRPPLAEVLRIGIQIAEGLAAAHDRNLIHRDIKPSNIWLEEPSGRVKILDFGLARVADSERSNDNPLTVEGTTVGTVEYMSPEQARGTALDPRTDLFSLGVVLYQMLTGKLPFKGPSTMAILTSLLADRPPAIHDSSPEIPNEVTEFVERLLVKNPEHRPTSAVEVASALRGMLDRLNATSVVEVVPAEAAPEPAKPRKKTGTRKTKRAGTRRSDRVEPKGKTLGFWVGAGVLGCLVLFGVTGLVITLNHFLKTTPPGTGTNATASGPTTAEGTGTPKERPRPKGGPSDIEHQVVRTMFFYFDVIEVRTSDGKVIELAPGDRPPEGRFSILALHGAHPPPPEELPFGPYEVDLLKQCPDLELVDFRRTDSTRANLSDLAAALPRCRIISREGVIEPKER